MTVATPDKLARLRALHPDWTIWQIGMWWWAAQGARWARADDLDDLASDLGEQEAPPDAVIRATSPGLDQEGP